MTTAATLLAGSVTPSKVQAYAGRALDLLQAIEKTIDCLSDNCDVLQVSSGGIAKHLKALQNIKIDAVLDPEKRVCELLSQCLQSIERMHVTATRKQQAARDDDRLHADDGVVEAYDAFIQALSDHHDIVHVLKEWVEVHDALQAPALEPVYPTASDLFKAIRAKS